MRGPLFDATNSKSGLVRLASGWLGFSRRGHHLSYGSQSPGQELVEFAIVLPLLILFLVGVFDLGRLFHATIVLTNATREGARYATFHSNDTTGIKNAVVQEAAASGITLTTGMVTTTCPCTSGNPAQVTVTYDFE